MNVWEFAIFLPYIFLGNALERFWSLTLLIPSNRTQAEINVAGSSKGLVNKTEMIWFGCFFLSTSLSLVVSKGLKPLYDILEPWAVTRTVSILPAGADAVLSAAGRAGHAGRLCTGTESAALPDRDPGSSDIELALPFELSVSPLLEDTRQCVLCILNSSCNTLIFKKHCNW